MDDSDSDSDTEIGHVNYSIADSALRNHTKTIPIDQWVEFVLATSPGAISDWANILCEGIMLNPSTTIMEDIRSYCSAHDESQQHKLWTAIVNRIISWAEEHIPDLPSASFPVTFVQNYPRIVGGGRSSYLWQSPSVLVLPRSVLSEHVSTSAATTPTDSGVHWNQVLACVEFTPGDPTKLTEALRTWMAQREKGSGGSAKVMS